MRHGRSVGLERNMFFLLVEKKLWMQGSRFSDSIGTDAAMLP